MDKDYYTEQREKAKEQREKELIVDGDRKTVNNRPWCQITIKELDVQLHLDFDR